MQKSDVYWVIKSQKQLKDRTTIDTEKLSQFTGYKIQARDVKFKTWSCCYLWHTNSWSYLEIQLCAETFTKICKQRLGCIKNAVNHIMWILSSHKRNSCSLVLKCLKLLCEKMHNVRIKYRPNCYSHGWSFWHLHLDIYIFLITVAFSFTYVKSYLRNIWKSQNSSPQYSSIVTKECGYISKRLKSFHSKLQPWMWKNSFLEDQM